MRARWALLWLFATSTAYADSNEGLPIGMEAAMSGGAITATVTAGAAGYYNPAGVAGGATDTIDVSANAYGIRVNHIEQPIYGPQGESQPGRVVNWVIAPTLLSYTRKITQRYYASFGLFVPATDDYTLRSRLRTNEGTEWFHLQSVRNTQYYAGLSGAMRVRDNLRVGVALLGGYSAISVLQNDTAGGADMRTASQITTASLYRYNLTLRAGVQWEPNQRWALGASVFAPEVAVGQRLTSATAYSAPTDVTNSSNNFGIVTTRQRGVGRVLSGVPYVRLGAAYRYDHGWVSLDGSLNLPLKGDAILSSTRELNFNIRAGVLHQFSEVWKLGAGVFTDRYSQTGDGLDFYGFSLGFIHANDMELKNGGVLRFVTSVSLRYAHGTGKDIGTSVSSILPGSEFMVASRSSPAYANEVSVSIGSGVSF